MKLVYKFKHQYNKNLYRLCEISKNLYNQALYMFKKELKDNDRWLFYQDLNSIMQNVTNIENEINYKLLKAQVSQQCLRLLDKNIKSYVKSIKDYSKNKTKYHGKPKLPNYKKDVNILVYTNQSCIIKNGYINLSKDLKIKIPQYDKYYERIKNFQQVRILPKIDKTFDIEIIYDYDCKNEQLNYDLYSSIDLGIDNLITIIFPDSKPILFNGKTIKSKNQYFNKTISKLKSKLTNNQKTSKRIRCLYSKRERQLNDIFHKISKQIINLLISKGIGNLVVGYNKGWKDSINIGKRNNQTFVNIPYLKLIDYLKYKCEMCGIELTINEESYTSKCDGLVFEQIEKHESYLGKRIKRGLFQSSTGKLINADVNGALNILRKVVGDSDYVNQIIDSGWLFQPIRVNVFENNTLKLMNNF